MTLGKFLLNPVENPAVLDTGTWDIRGASEILKSMVKENWNTLKTLRSVSSNAVPISNDMTVFKSSFSERDNSRYFVADLRDKQTVILEIGRTSEKHTLSSPFLSMEISVDETITAYPAYDKNLAVYCTEINPKKGPKTLGTVSRIGIGVRMSTAVWPGIWEALKTTGSSANAIQNSVRELSLFDDLAAGIPQKKNHLYSFGSVEEGHTGSTFEGLWVSGVISDLKTPGVFSYGADADHIQVKRGSNGISKAKATLRASKYYTFYTMDLSDILDYSAVLKGGNGIDYLNKKVSGGQLRKQIVAYHTESVKVGSEIYKLKEALLNRFIGKYWDALDVLEELYEFTVNMKGSKRFDLEMSVDESPEGIDVFKNITGPEEYFFLLRESKRRGLPITHLAPNLGVEKGTDYRGPDGMEELSSRITLLSDLSEEFGIMLDCHSGDDLSRDTRKTIGKAARGRIHFKISPSLQLIFAEALYDLLPEQFRVWWDMTARYVREQTEKGSSFAKKCLNDAMRIGTPNPHTALFYYYHFAPVGLRDENGFLNRNFFYTLPEGFYKEYKKRVEENLYEVTSDLYGM